jgi:hypothetical protein
MTFPEHRLAKRAFAALCLTGFVCLALYSTGLPAADLAWDDGPGHRSVPLRIEGTRDAGFDLLPPAFTGLSFTNRLFGEMFLTNAVAHNGAGVAASDVAGDGLCDLYFANLQGAKRLYRNLGGKTSLWLRAGESIHIAAAAGHIEAVKQYLADGVNVRDEDGGTPLSDAVFWAAFLADASAGSSNGHREVAELLIEEKV